MGVALSERRQLRRALQYYAVNTLDGSNIGSVLVIQDVTESPKCCAS